MKSKKDFHKEQKTQKAKFLSQIDPTEHNFFNRVWRTCSGGQDVTTGLCALKLFIDWADEHGTTNIPFIKLYFDFMRPLSKTSPYFPLAQTTNLKKLNNMVRLLTIAIDNPTDHNPSKILWLKEDYLIGDSRLKSPVFCDIIDFWWNQKSQGYFYYHKDDAGKMEKAVVALNDIPPNDRT